MSTALGRIYDRLINRARKLGLHGLVDDLQKTKQSGKFNYHKFVRDCKAVGINPAFVLSQDYKESVIRFRLTGSMPEVKMVKVLDELMYVLGLEGLLERTKVKPMTEFYKGLLSSGIKDLPTVGVMMAKEVRKTYHLPDCPNLFEFCKENNVYLIFLTDNAPVEGIFLSTDEYLFIAIKKGYIPRMHWTLAHELGHYFMGHEGLDLDKELDPDERLDKRTEDYVRNVKKEEGYADSFASYLIMSLDVKTPNPECCISKKALSYRLGGEADFTPKCKDMDVSKYALNGFLRAHKEELLYTLGEPGSFYRNVKEYLWDI